MTPFPQGKYYRKTKHRDPRFQIYQPGYCAQSRMWIPGDWVTIDKRTWDYNRECHHSAYVRTRVFQGPMGPMMDVYQRQAWEYFSGPVSMTVHQPSRGTFLPFIIYSAGDKIRRDSVYVLRERGFLVPRYSIHPHTKKVMDQIEALGIPPELHSEECATPETAVDVWVDIFSQSLRSEDESFDQLLKLYPDPAAIEVAMTVLLRQAMTVIRLEWAHARGLREPYRTVESERQRYLAMRAKVLHTVGEDFSTWEEEYRTKINQEARAALDASHGGYGPGHFVVPFMDSSGAHEPIGQWDAPWSYKKDVLIEKLGYILLA